MNFNLLSKYRIQLMGLAALMVIVCHAPQYGVAMPYTLGKLLARGGLGVDIFLFLSGLGCWYSLSKGVNLKHWYYKRFIRIFIPYFLMQIPFWLWRFSIGSFSLSEEFLVFSTIEFWTRHIGAWYVALLLPLYIITPAIYRLFLLKNRFLIASLLVVIIIVVCMLNINMFVGKEHEILKNLQWALGRVPSFIIGMSLAPLVKRGVNVNKVVLIILPIFLYYFINTLTSHEANTEWCLVLPALTIYVILLEKLNKASYVYNFISWMGLVSLESYLANIYLCATLKQSVMPFRDDYTILTGGYLEYTIVILFGILLSYLINILSKQIILKFYVSN